MSHEKLTERITIRFTPEELKTFKQMAHEENERKVSALLRRILLASLKKRNRNLGRDNPDPISGDGPTLTPRG